MYKFIYNNNVIDVVETVKYLRYLEKSKHFVITDSTSANCVQGSDNETVYLLQGASLPATLNYKIVTVKKIDKQEYQQLKQLLKNNKTVCGDTAQLIEARKNKIEELKQECAAVIKQGISIKLSDNDYHQFELTIEDQLNLNILKTKLDQGAQLIIYHEKGCTCKLYDRVDIEKIIFEANRHIEYNTTYFNFMRHCINNMNDMDLINNVHYGDELLIPDYNRLLHSL